MFDQLVILIVGFFTVLALFRGFIREFLGIIGLVLAIMGTYSLTPLATAMILQTVPSYMLAQLIGGITTFLFMMILTGIMSNSLANALTRIRHGVFDTILGGIVGFIKGYLVCFLVYFFVLLSIPVLNPETDVTDESTELSPKWITEARVYPILKMTREYIDGHIMANYETGKIHFGRLKKEETTEPLANTPRKKRQSSEPPVS